MEPADIDWKNIESRFIRDDLYEHINAPKWLDLSAPDSAAAAAVDEAWFCRPECRHPKTPEDFLLKSSPSPNLKKPKRPNSPQVLPLGERKANNQSLKKRGAIMSLLLPPSSPAREPAKSKANGNVKKFREDLENQDPNLLANNSTSTSNRPPKKTLKEAIKSSAEKKVMENQAEEGNEEEMRRGKKPLPRLRSTLSARNLFSGRDILGQISEFCNEIKKLAVGKERNSASVSAAAKEVAKETEKEERKVLLVDTKPKDVETEVEKPSVLKEVRACPPTPQRFPSPSSRRLRSTRSAANISISPLKPAASKGVLPKDEECNRVSVAAAAAAESEGNSVDMFWFLKPCTY